MPVAQPRVPEMVRKRQLPRYFTWRGGRPCWNPGPGLRAKGYRRVDLKTPDGAGWLTLGAAIDAAELLNQSADKALPLELPRAERTLTALFDLYRAHDYYRKNLKPRTRADYDDHMRILEAWAGDTPVAAIKRGDVTTLYGALREARGLTRANAILRTLRLTLNFAVNELEWLERNRAAKLKMQSPEGRLSHWSIDEIVTFVAAADWLGSHGQGDAQILGLSCGQNRSDVITMPRLELAGDVFKMSRGKTNNTYYFPALKILRARLEAARDRNAALFPNVVWPTEIVCTTTGLSYAADGDFFIHEHLAVRMVASGLVFVVAQLAGEFPDIAALRGSRIYQWMRTLPADTLFNLPFTPMPSLWGKTFQDLRDTAITMLLTHTRGDMARVANWSGLSLRTVQSIADKHYFVRNAELAADTGKVIDAFFATTQIGAA